MAEPLSLPPVPEPPKGERLKNKVVLLTGAAQGIGEAIVATFASQQAKLVISDIQAEKVEKVAAHWREQGADVVAIKADVSRQQDLHAMAKLAIELHGRIDVLVNCAGVNVFRDPLQMTEDDWHRCFAIDLDGAWYGCKAVLPQMIEQGIGSIINIASGIEYAPKGIRVNAIAPGYIETQLNVDYWNGFADPHAERQRAFDLHPPRRIGQPIEVAMTAVFLASDEAPFINASCITIDGGRSVMYHD